MNDTFLKVCRGEKADYTPIWIMRQAGRYLPQYQEVRSKVDFLTLCKTPELAAKVTIQPVEILGVDAAILFSDILIPLEAIGMGLRFEEEKGPIFDKPIRDIKAVKRLIDINPKEHVPFVLETVKILKKELKVPLIGFSGAPFTLATYMIEGGSSKTYLNTKKMMYTDQQLFKSLMDKLTTNTISYLKGQITSGADAVQLFDSWAGILSPDDYRNFAFPYVLKIISELKTLKVPIIYFVNNCGGLLEIARECGSDVIGIDWRVDLSNAIDRIGKDKVIQGNLEPIILFSDKNQIKKAATDIIQKGKMANGHIFNLGHGILPTTPVDNLKILIDVVHEMG
ncbi:MAG: uroporphyrinogen decarboxylase [Nitrospirae bacterium]|nr:uroporphyrinogen decarboxylase [Nitrospirota bacterium]